MIDSLLLAPIPTSRSFQRCLYNIIDWVASIEASLITGIQLIKLISVAENYDTRRFSADEGNYVFKLYMNMIYKRVISKY